MEAASPGGLQEILRSLNRHPVTRLSQASFFIQGESRHGGDYAYAEARQISARTVILGAPSEYGIADPQIRAALEACLELARSTQSMVAAGDRLTAARSAVDLVRAYDKVLENIHLVPLSILDQQRVREQLAPVKELLKKYRLR